jgi:hypothetical protein
MKPSSLGIVFGPTILRGDTATLVREGEISVA